MGFLQAGEGRVQGEGILGRQHRRSKGLVDDLWGTANGLVWLEPRMGVHWERGYSRRYNINLKPMIPTAQSMVPLLSAKHSVNSGNQGDSVRLGKKCLLVSQALLLKYLCSTGCGGKMGPQERLETELPEPRPTAR